jgi:hypothetical protein
MSRRLSREDGSVLLVSVFATLAMLLLGLALLATVDVQAQESGNEKTRDQAFNLSEAVLNNEAFVLGRIWPGSPATAPTAIASTEFCGATSAYFGSTIGALPVAGTPAAAVQTNVNNAYTDPNYATAPWRVTICDDTSGGAVWDDALLTTAKNWDANANDKVWVRSESTVAGKTRTVVALVQGIKQRAFDSRFGLIAGSVGDDLGSTINTLSTAGTNGGVLGGVLNPLLGGTPTVAQDSTAPSGSTGVTGIRCGAADLNGTVTGLGLCTTGSVAALGAGLPIVSTIAAGTRNENYPSIVSSRNAISQLRDQAKASGTYTAVSAGTAPKSAGSLTNGSDRLPSGTIAPCDISGSPDATKVVFIEQVGTSGLSGSVGGPGDQYCAVDVSQAKTWKALIIGSGRVVLTGNGSATASTDRTKNSFTGVVYGLNLQRLPVAEGGRGLGDAVSLVPSVPAREIVRIDKGAHVHGSVAVDGKSGSVGIYPPALTVNNGALIDAAVPCRGLTSCLTNTTLKLLSGVGDVVTGLLDALGLSAVTSIVNNLTGQLAPQRESYGSAITSDVAAVNAVKVLGPSAIVPGTFKDLQAR